MNKLSQPFIFLIFVSLVFSACAGPATPSETDRLTVSVSVLPQKYFLERIGGDLVNVNVMVGPGDSPHSYEPKASQMTALSDSAVYFSVGVEFEHAWMDRIVSANPEMLIVDLTQGLELLPAIAHDDEDEVVDENEEDADHTDEMDPHIWTSPANGISMAQIITDTLAELDPQHADTYRANLETFLDDIVQLQSEIDAALENLDSRKFMVFHPAWGYFAQEFGLQQIPIEAAGSEPSAAELVGLIAIAKEENITVIFAQPEFSTRSADYIASEIGGKVVLISPLAEDWLDNLRLVAATFAEEL
jgi:zinc transport system substrate-binding protein